MTQLQRVGVVCTACDWSGGRTARCEEVCRYGICPKCGQPLRKRDAMMNRRRKIAMDDLGGEPHEGRGRGHL